MKSLNKKYFDLIILMFILLAGMKFTYKIWTIIDIGLYDETAYLNDGLNLLSAGFPAAENSPLYAMWYWVLSVFIHNKVYLYYINYILLTILPPAVLYILMRKHQVSNILSLGASFFLLISVNNLETWPKISHFALIVVMIFFVFIDNRHFIKSFSIMGIGFLMASFARPELVVSYILIALPMLAVCIRRILIKRYLCKKEIVYVIGFGVMSLLFLGTLGSPLGGDRSFVAFSQHYALNWVDWHKSAMNPWTDFESIIKKDFGNVHSTTEAIIVNPVNFFKHISYNLLNYFKSVLGFWEHFDILAPHTSLKFEKLEFYFILSVIFIYMIGIRKFVTENFRNVVSKNIYLVTGLIIFIIPELISCIIIYPREHYILPQVVSFTFVFLLFVPQYNLRLNKTNLITASFLLLAITPTLTIDYHFYNPFSTQTISVIEYIENMHITGPVNMLEADGGYATYLGNNFKWISETSKNTNFNQFLKEDHINMVVVSDSLLNDRRFSDDNEWNEFLTVHDNFFKVKIPNTRMSLIYDKKLIQK